MVRWTWARKSSSVRVGPSERARTCPVTTSRLRMKLRVPWRMDSNSRRSTMPGRSGRFGSFRSKAWTPGEFIGADHPFPPLSHLWSVSVQGADVLSLLVEVLLVDRRQPVPDQVGLE